MFKPSKFLLSLMAMTIPFVAFCDETPPPDIIIIPPKGNQKKIPFKFPSSIIYESSTACLSTSMPYICATIEVADIDGDVYSSTMVTPEEPCGYLDIQPSSTITVTFDNGIILEGTY